MSDSPQRPESGNPNPALNPYDEALHRVRAELEKIVRPIVAEFDKQKKRKTSLPRVDSTY
jgi:hypothetical protein